MAMTVRCPGCGLQQRVDESGRCRECREVLPHGDFEEQRFSRRAPWRDDDRDEDDSPRRREGSSGSALPWVLAAVGGGVLLLVVACGGAFFMLARNTTVTTTTGGPGPNPGGPNPAPPNNVGPKPPLAPAWSVKADPSPLPPARVTRPDQTAKLNAAAPPLLGAVDPHITVVPGSPSPFLASGSSGVVGGNNHREVWDLRTMEKVGELGAWRRSFGALTPDGAYLAGHLDEGRVSYAVYSCKDRKLAFEVDDRGLRGVSFYGFAGSRRFLIANAWGKYTCSVFDVPSGRKSIQFETEPHNKSEPWAPSPGGRYLALSSGAGVHFYDLDQGASAGKFAAPPAWGGSARREMAFSADGKELALLFESARGTHIYAWDVVGNRPACDFLIPADAVSRLKTPGRYPGRHLEWLADGSGWMFRGEVLIDRRTGAPAWRMELGEDAGFSPRHVVGSTHVSRFKSLRAKDGLEIVGTGLELVEIRRGEGNLAQLAPGGEPVAPSKAEAAEAAVSKLGGSIERDPRLPGNPVVGVGFHPGKLTDADLPALAALPQLRKLGLTLSRVTDDGILELKKLPKLEELYLSGCPALTDKGTARVGELTRLRALMLSYDSITNDSVSHLKGLTSLRKLSLSTTKVDDGALVHLKGLTELRELNLYNVGDFKTGKSVTDAGLAHIQGLTKLEVLLIPNSRVTGKGMAHLKGMTGLRELNLFHTSVDDAGLAHLKGLAKLEKLYLSGTTFTDDGLEALAGMKQLKELDLGFSKLSDKGMAHLKGLTELRSLEIGSTAVGDDGLAHLKGMTKLTRLNVVTRKVTDKGLAHLTGCKGLVQLSASGEGITDAGLEHLQGLPRLGTVWLYRTKVTPAGVAQLKKSLPRVSVYLK